MEDRHIHGTVMHMELNGGTVINHGTIMHLDGGYNHVNNYGSIMHNDGATVYGGTGKSEPKVVYRDRIIYKDRYVSNPNDERVRQLEAKLKDTQKKLDAADKETRRLSQLVREYEIGARKSENEDLRHTRELLEIVMQANRDAALRIRELERGVCDQYLRQQIDPWDMRPTKEDAKRLLRMFNALIESEEVEL